MRALFQLKNANWFNNVSGFIIGRSMYYNSIQNDIKDTDAYIEMLKEFNVPIILNCDFGHIGPTVPIRCNAYCQISIENNNIKFKYKD